MASSYKWKKLVYGNNIVQSNLSYPPTIASTPAAFTSAAGTSNVCTDADYNPGVAYTAGDLLFYTDGATIYDSTGAIMNGGNLNGLSATPNTAKQSQNAVIFKSTETDYWWVLVAEPGGRIYVSTVLMTGNSGRGTVTERHTTLNSGAGITDRFFGFYSASTSNYGIAVHQAGNALWKSFRITGITSHNPVFTPIIPMATGLNSYANNDAANHSTAKFNSKDRVATVYQAAIGTAGTPVTSAIVEVGTLDPATGTMGKMTQFTIPIKDAGPVTKGSGVDGRFKAYDLEWDGTTLYVPVYDTVKGMGINWYKFDNNNVVTSSGSVINSFTGIDTYADRAFFGMYKDPYDDIIYITSPYVINNTGGYSSNYNDTYSIDRIGAIRNTSDTSTVVYTDSLANTGAGEVGKGLPNRTIKDEASGPSDNFRLSPCEPQYEYVLDENGTIWKLDANLNATEIADVSTIANRGNIAAQKETGFIYLLAGTAVTQSIYKIDPVTGTVDSGTVLSDAGSSITDYELIAGIDGSATDLKAVIDTSGGNKVATIVVSTGVTTPAGNAQAGITPVALAVIGANYFITYTGTNRVYKNNGTTWTLLANTNAGLTHYMKGLSTDDTILYGYVDNKRYTINQSTGEATLPLDITINTTTTWNYEVNSATIWRTFAVATDDPDLGPEVGNVITISNGAGCFTVGEYHSGTTAIGTILSSSETCEECNGGDPDCKLLVSCATASGLARKVIGVTNDNTCAVGSVYQITGNAQTSDQLNQCVTAVSNYKSLWVSFSDGSLGLIDTVNGIITEKNIGFTSAEDIGFNKHGVGFVSSGNTLSTFTPLSDTDPGIALKLDSVVLPTAEVMDFNSDCDMVTGGVIGGTTQVSVHSINNTGTLTSVSPTLYNSNVRLTGDIAISGSTYYCTGNATPSTHFPFTNDLFTLDSATLTNTTVANLTSTLSLTANEIVTGIEFVGSILYVLTWNATNQALKLYNVNKSTGALVGSGLSLQSPSGQVKFATSPTGLAYNNVCDYWESASFQLELHTTCEVCYNASTSVDTYYELIECSTGFSTYTNSNLASYVGKIVNTGTPGKCFTVYNYDVSSCPGCASVTVVSDYADCTTCGASQSVCYRLLKCNDPGTDPKYTTEALTANISAFMGKSIQLDGEYFCRTVDSLGTSTDLASAVSHDILNAFKTCNACNFGIKLTDCKQSNKSIYVDYATSPALHTYIGSSNIVTIQDLGNGEDKIGWLVDSRIYGSVETLYPSALLVTAYADCTAYEFASAPSTYRFQWCCSGTSTPLVVFYLLGNNTQGSNGDYATDYTPGALQTLISQNSSYTTPGGQVVEGCFIVEQVLGVVPSLLEDPANCDLGPWGITNADTACTNCNQIFNVDCNQGVGEAYEILNCDVTQPNTSIKQTVLNEYVGGLASDLTYHVFSPNSPDLTPEGNQFKDQCWKRCIHGDLIHGVNWPFGRLNYQQWLYLARPTSPTGFTNMASTKATISNQTYNKFGTFVHSAHETVTIGAKTYTKGDLMFVSDGRVVYNSSGVEMANGNFTLKGGTNEGRTGDNGSLVGASQQCVIVPDPSHGKFAATNTYRQYFIIQNTAESGRLWYSKLNMDTSDGLGEVMSPAPQLMGGMEDTIDGLGNTILGGSSERLTVSSRPSIPATSNDTYWVLDIKPYAPNLFFFTPGTIRAWKIDDTLGMAAEPVLSNMFGSNALPGKINAGSTNLRQWARIKMSPDNKWVAVTGNKDGKAWTQLYSFDKDTGTCAYETMWDMSEPAPICQDVSWSYTGPPAGFQTFNGNPYDFEFPDMDINLNVLGYNRPGCNAEIETNFIPYTHAIEFGENCLYTIRSGMAYPPWRLDFESSAVMNSQSCGDQTENKKGKLFKVDLNQDGTYGTMDYVQQIFHLPHDPANSVTGFTYPMGRSGDEQIDFSQGVGPQMGGDNGGYMYPCPIPNGSYVTDLIMGPDYSLYYGAIATATYGVVSNTKVWEDIIHVGEATLPYPASALTWTNTEYVGQTDGQTAFWWPNPSSPDSRDTIASTASIGRLMLWDPNLNESSLYPPEWGACSTVGCFNGASIALSQGSLIDFGFPQYIKRMCYANNDYIPAAGIQSVAVSCDSDADACAFIPPVIENPGFAICPCGAGTPDGCTEGNGLDCWTTSKDYSLTNSNTDKQTLLPGSGGGVAYWQSLKEAVDSLDLGPQAVQFVVSFPLPGAVSPNSVYGPCAALAGYTIGPLESGPTTNYPKAYYANGTHVNKTYTVTKAQFKDAVMESFNNIKELLEGTFSVAGGYPNQLYVNFVANGTPGSATYGDEVGTGNLSTSSTLTNATIGGTIGYTSGGVSGIGDFRVWIDRFSSTTNPASAWCVGGQSCTDAATCGTNLNTGHASGVLAWANRPYNNNYLGGTEPIYATNSSYDPANPTANWILNPDAARHDGYCNIRFDLNEQWRKPNDAVSLSPHGTFDIVAVATHEIGHAFGWNHAWHQRDNDSDDFPSAGTDSCNRGYTTSNSDMLFESFMAAFADPNNDWNNPNTGYYGWTTDCEMMGPGGEYERTLACVTYGWGALYAGAPGTYECHWPSGERSWQCPACNAECYYSENPSLLTYLPGEPEDVVKWTNDPTGSSTNCYTVTQVQDIPDGSTLYFPTSISDLTGYADCYQCEISSLPPCWKLKKINCEYGAPLAPATIITSTDMSIYCYPPDNNGEYTQSQIISLLGEEYAGACYEVECGWDPYAENIDGCDGAIAVTVNQMFPSENACCPPMPIMCYTLTACHDSNISFVTSVDMTPQLYTNPVVQLTYIPGQVLIMYPNENLSSATCWKITECGTCGDGGGCIVDAPGLVVLTESFTCFICEQNVLVDAIKLIACDNGEVISGVVPTVDLATAFLYGQIVKIPQYPDGEGNPRCWNVEADQVLQLGTYVNVYETCATCALCCPPGGPTAGCTDPTALNWCPGCAVPCGSGVNYNECCIYAGCPSLCLDPTAIDYAPGGSCDCAGVEGGDDYSCCKYAVAVPPFDAGYEQDCVNCLDVTEIDTVFQKVQKLCGNCNPPEGLTLTEYDCDFELPVPPDQPLPAIYGCTDSAAINYNPDAEIDNGSCYYINGCTDPNACNFDQDAITPNLSVCVYAGTCGCFDIDNYCIGCMDINACNYCYTCDVPDNSLCIYDGSCYCCLDPEATNYGGPANPNGDGTGCMFNDQSSCVYSPISTCFDNRNIYVYYDMSSMSVTGFGGYTGDAAKLAYYIFIRQTVEAAVQQIINQIPNANINVYYLPVSQQGGNNAVELKTPENSTNTGTYNDIPASCVANPIQSICYSNAYGSNGVTSNGSTNQAASANEKYLKWFMYPIHGNSAWVATREKVPFFCLKKNKQTELLQGTDAVGTDLHNLFVELSGRYEDGVYVNNLPGTQVDPWNDVNINPEYAGFSDTYHQFEGGDTTAICIAFIDEVSSEYAGSINPSTVAAFDSQDGTQVCGTSNWIGAANASVTQAFFHEDYDAFTLAHEWGYDLSTTGAPILAGSGQSLNGGLGVGYQTGQFSALIMPTKGNTSALGQSNFAMFVHLYACVGQGEDVTASGHIPCNSFTDLPGVLDWSTPNAPSMVFATDPSIPNPMYTDPDNTAGYLGMSLSHYGVRWKAPTSTENVMELTADQIYEAIYEQLCE
tara:strand:- start:26927 stop:37831 length:10905 start_codon:yes stop_codon:yes gene_type:complete